MVKIIREEEAVKKYLEDVKKIFDIYRMSDQFELKDSYKNKRIKKVFKKIEENSVDFGGEIQTKILKENLLGNRSLKDIATEIQYSPAHLYTVRQKILKEFVTIIFEVILV